MSEQMAITSNQEQSLLAGPQLKAGSTFKSFLLPVSSEMQQKRESLETQVANERPSAATYNLCEKPTKEFIENGGSSSTNNTTVCAFIAILIAELAGEFKRAMTIINEVLGSDLEDKDNLCRVLVADLSNPTFECGDDEGASEAEITVEAVSNTICKLNYYAENAWHPEIQAAALKGLEELKVKVLGLQSGVLKVGTNNNAKVGGDQYGTLRTSK
jgi:hypothetical protein